MQAESFCMTGLGLDDSLFLGGRLSSKIQGRGDPSPVGCWHAAPQTPIASLGASSGEPSGHGGAPAAFQEPRAKSDTSSRRQSRHRGGARPPARLEGPRGAPCSPRGLCPGPCPHAPIGPFPPRPTRTRVDAARPRRPEPLPRGSPPVFSR